MDPTKALNNARYYLALAEECQSGNERHEYLVRAARAYESVDEWVTKGGFLPRQWEFPKGEGT